MDEETEASPPEQREAGPAIWSNPALETKEYRDEERSLDGLVFRVKRRSLTYTEEMRLAAITIQKEKGVDTIELLARTVALTVKDSNFGLTPRIVREELPSRPKLAAFLVDWLCGDTITNWSLRSEDDLRKKRGP